MFVKVLFVIYSVDELLRVLVFRSSLINKGNNSASHIAYSEVNGKLGHTFSQSNTIT